ncbi:hypothetical protein AUEXF2481DRAFT_114587 [Aureobasidium subglaciale EXF-2481]|uniref:Uncharacterized protein n=1 Tax=Aureobasidium subglaciale (strain EXF-2481) TaxID=1043005 RepID=A0A074YQJ5_AURSE|nr:uncharacterized protein AUEXF2481DRAFT_114587 [Aureobasidium subglaciale EXF-2481]KER00039.1 hypothetical protein AUEXF2481DRAFT_114587 [Aureobasidium subglaciale EXF-2481]
MPFAESSIPDVDNVSAKQRMTMREEGRCCHEALIGSRNSPIDPRNTRFLKYPSTKSEVAVWICSVPNEKSGERTLCDFLLSTSMQAEMMECNEGRFLSCQARKGKPACLSNAGGNCHQPLSASTLSPLFPLFVRRDGRAAGDFANMGLAKPLRLKVRLVQKGTWESKMGWWIRRSPRHWSAPPGLNSTSCSQPHKKKIARPPSIVEIKIGRRQSGLFADSNICQSLEPSLPRSFCRGVWK